jgi:Sulfotransferase domain
MQSGDLASASFLGPDLGDVPADKTRSSLGDYDPLAHPFRIHSLSGMTKRTLRNTLLTANRPTVGARMLPTFLIAGAGRCGTTSMFATLSQHPAIGHPFLPWNWEVHFFDNKYHHGLTWYRCHFPLRARVERAARAVGANTPHAFESGVSYMFHPLAPERVKRDLPGVKLLVLLRDPVERAFSAHANSVSKKCEMEPFERAFELEDSRLVGEVEKILANPFYESVSYRHHAYRRRGQYIDQLERLEKLFGRERIHVVDSASFFSDPVPCYDRTLEFIGLPNAGYPDFKHLNARPRPAPISDSVRKKLRDHYRPYDERLVKWLGWEPTWCRQHS